MTSKSNITPAESSSRPAVKVGDNLWLFDTNRRVYAKDASGKSYGGPIFREHFVSYGITGETKKSWLISQGWQVVKVNKATLRSADRSGSSHWFTAEGMAERIWLDTHKSKILHLAEYSATNDQLRQIAVILGYAPEQTP